MTKERANTGEFWSEQTPQHLSDGKVLFGDPAGRGLAPVVLGEKRNTRPHSPDHHKYIIDSLV